MKKIFFLAALIVMPMSTFAAECTLTPSEIQITNKIITVFSDKGPIIDQALAQGDTNNVEIIKDMRLDLIERMSLTATCSENGHSSFMTLVDDLKETINQMKDNQPLPAMDKIETADQAMLFLHNHIFGALTQSAINAAQSDTTINFDVAGDMGFFKGNADATMTVNGKVWEQGDINGVMTMAGNFMVTNVFAGETIDGSLDMDMNIIQKAQTLYARINKLDINSASNSQELIEMKAELKKFLDITKNKYIILDSDDAWFDDIMPAQGLTTLFEDLKNTALFAFYHQEGNTYYGTINPELCKLMPDQYDVNECLTVYKESLKYTNNKGFITLTNNNDTYSLSVTDQFLQEEDKTDELQQLVGQKIVTWNNQQITNASLNISDDDIAIKLQYINPTLTITAITPDGMLTIYGTLTQDTIDLNGEFDSSEAASILEPNKATFSLMAKKINDYSTTMAISLDILSEATSLFSINADINQSASPLESFTATAPINTITSDTVDAMMMDSE